MTLIVIWIGCSVITSVITTKILATHYFKIVDGYVNDICRETKLFVQKSLEQVNKR